MPAFGTSTLPITALFLVLGVIVGACLAGIVLTTRTELRRRSARPGVFLAHEALWDLGASFLLGTPIVLCCAIVVIARGGASIAPGLFFGGVAALSYSLVLPWQLAADYRRRRRIRLDPNLRLLVGQIARLRKPWLPVLAASPYFAALALLLGPGGGVGTPSEGDVAAGALFGVLAVGLLSWGVQCLQVCRTLRRQEARR